MTLADRDIDALAVAGNAPTDDEDSSLPGLGLQAYALGIAHEFDPYFGLSISRVDPLPTSYPPFMTTYCIWDAYAYC